MQASILPFQYGWYWIHYGLQAFKKQPMALIFWALVTNLLVNISYLIPIIGQIALIVLTPSLTFIVLNACRRILKDERMLLKDWLAPLKENKIFAKLLQLGGIYFFFLFIASLIATLPFISTINAALPTDGQINPNELIQVVKTPVIIFLIQYLVITILFWHAPALIGWHAVPMKQALFFSIIACWRNKWPMIVYGVFWAFIYYLFHFFSNYLLSTIGSDLTYFLLTFVSLMVFAILYSTFYPIYKTVFNVNDGIQLKP